MPKVSEESPFPVWEHFLSKTTSRCPWYEAQCVTWTRALKCFISTLHVSSPLPFTHVSMYISSQNCWPTVLSVALWTVAEQGLNSVLAGFLICLSNDSAEGLVLLSTELCFISSSSPVSAINEDLKIVEEWYKSKHCILTLHRNQNESWP